MHEKYKKIFDLYIDDDYYTEQINNDEQYIKISKQISLIQNELKIYLNSVNNDGQTIEKLDDAYMKLSDIYRYYDFVEGFSLGILTGLHCHHTKQELVKKISKIITDSAGGQ